MTRETTRVIRRHMKIYFEKPLQKAIIKERKNRFIFLIEIGGEIVEAHCPATGIIVY